MISREKLLRFGNEKYTKCDQVMES